MVLSEDEDQLSCWPEGSGVFSSKYIYKAFLYGAIDLEPWSCGTLGRHPSARYYYGLHLGTNAALMTD